MNVRPCPRRDTRSNAWPVLNRKQCAEQTVTILSGPSANREAADEVVNTIKLVIFDIAGTVIEDHGEVLSSFALALEQSGISVAENELRERKGASKREVIRHFIERNARAVETATAERIERVYADFRRMLDQQYESSRVVPIKDAQRTFEWLLERNISIAATTGFDREVTEMILAKPGGDDSSPTRSVARTSCSAAPRLT